MISLRYGVRLVRQRPGSLEAFEESMRCRSDHSETSSGSGIQSFAPGPFDIKFAVVVRIHQSIHPGAQFAQFHQVVAHCGFQRNVQGMRVGLQFGGHLRRDTCRPVDPGIAFGAGQSEDMGDGLSTIDQIALEPCQSHLVGLCLDDFIDGACLQKRGATG